MRIEVMFQNVARVLYEIIKMYRLNYFHTLIRLGFDDKTG